MKITDIKEVTDLFYAINLDKLTIQPIKSPDESPWRTYLTCHIYPNFGNFTIYMRLFNGKKEVTSYSRKGWTFLFKEYMHINWNTRLCWYIITDNTGKWKKGMDYPDLGGAFFHEKSSTNVWNKVSLDMDDLIKLGWKKFFDLSDEYYSYEHERLYSSLIANSEAVRKKEVSPEKMGEQVLYRQQYRKQVADFIDSIPVNKRRVYGKSITKMRKYLDRYCNQIWDITIKEEYRE